MHHISSNKDFRYFPKPDFCYLCGRPLDKSEEENCDHCPPAALFEEADLKNYALKMPAHLKCNSAWSDFDDRAAAIWSVITKKEKNAQRMAKIVRSLNAALNGAQKVVLNVAFEKLNHRILRMGHALFYKQFLPVGTPNQIFSPTQELDKDTLLPKDRQVSLSMKLCEALVHAQIQDKYNSIISHRGKFRFISTFTTSDDGQDLCVYAFDINGANFFNPEITGTPRCHVGCFPWLRPPGAPQMERPVIVIPEAFTSYPFKFRWKEKRQR